MTFLFDAVEAGDVEEVRQLLGQGADARERDSDGLHALDLAAESGQLAVAEALLAHDPGLASLPGYYGRPPLTSAVLNGHTAVVALLLTRGADPRQSAGGPGDGQSSGASNGIGRPLEHAAQEGYIDIVELLLAHDPGLIDLPGAFGRTALAAAAAGGHLAVVDLLLARGADLRASLHEGTSALHWAAMQGHTAVVERLLAQDPSMINVAGEDDGCPALQLAASEGHPGTVRALLALGADPRLGATIKGTRPLDHAAQKGQLEVVQILLDHDPELLELPGYLQRTALTCAAGNGHTAVVELLLARGANPRARLTDGRRALDWAAHGGHAQVLELLLARDPELLELPGYRERTPLVVAAGGGKLAAVELLLSRGADPHARLEGGARALDWAAGRGHPAVVERLLQHDPELLELPGEAGHTPLMEAAGYGYADVVQLLLDKGADPTRRAADGERALDWAAQEGHEDAALCLLEHDAGLVDLPGYHGHTPLVAAAGNGSLEVVEILLQHGANPEQRLPDGSHALDWASLKGDVRICEMLLERAPQLLDTPGCQGRTPLAAAAGAGHAAVVALLLQHGADPRRSLAEGTRPLDWAAWGGHRKVVEQLLAHDPELLDLPGERERTALGAAAAGGHTELVDLLLACGADPEKASATGITALEWPAHNGHWETLEHLLARTGKPDAASRALLAAAYGGQEKVVRALLARGADPRQQRSDGANSLDLASGMGHVAVVKALLEFDNTLVGAR